MEQGVQDRSTDRAIKEAGCYFLTLLQWGLRDGGKEYPNTTELVDDWLKRVKGEAIRNGWLQEDMLVVDPMAVYNYARGEAVCDAVRQVEKKPEGDTYIVCWKKPMHTHFTLVYRGVSWDPLPPGRAAAAAYKVASYRVLG